MKGSVIVALQTDNIVTPQDIITGFTTTVVNTILSGIYHLGNLPMEGGFQCVPTNLMDHINNLSTIPNVGSVDTEVNALMIYNSLVAIVTNLTRVGTFAWTRYSQSDAGLTLVGSKNGKVLFNTSQIRSLATVNSNHNVAVDNIIIASGLNTLLSNLLTAWTNTVKYSYTNSTTQCHSSCHNDCYSDCHGDCNSSCYGDSYGLAP